MTHPFGGESRDRCRKHVETQWAGASSRRFGDAAKAGVQ